MWFELTLTCAYYYNIPTVYSKEKQINQYIIKTVATYHM